MIGNIWGDDHPYILQYNGNLITTLNIKMTHEKGITDEEKANLKKTIHNIIEKNFEIAKKAYGDDSIHFLFYVS